MGNILKKEILALAAFSIIGVGSLTSYNQVINEKQHSSVEEKKENIITASMNQSDIPLNHKWWIVNTKLDRFFKVFKFIIYWTHITKRPMNSYVIKPVDIVL